MVIEVFSAHSGGRYWRRLLQEWERAGHTVREVAAFDDSFYRKKRGTAGRLWMRCITYVGFPLKAWFKLRFARHSPDTVRIVITSPFFLPTVAAWARGRRGSPIVNIVNDLFPEALIHAGMLKPGGVVAQRLGSMTRFSFKRCDATVFLGARLQAYAEQTYGKARRSQIVPVGADALFVREASPDFPQRTDQLQILYSGVMGHMHDSETILELCRAGPPAKVSLTIHSSGVGYNKLTRGIARLDHDQARWISLHGPLPDQTWRETLNRHQVGLVTLKPGAQYISMPSKTYSALAAGQAILAICPVDSDLAELVRAHNCGWVIPPGQAAELKSLLIHLAANPAEVHAKRLEAFHAGHSLYDMTAISRQYLDLFNFLLETNRNPDAHGR